MHSALSFVLPEQIDRRLLAPQLCGLVAFGLLFLSPASTLLRDWWSDPEAGHGLLLAPLALYLAWNAGRAPGARPQPGWGIALLAAAVFLRYAGSLAAELFTLRVSLLAALFALVIFVAGIRQLIHWWLPSLLLALSIPLPAVVLGTLALPLQFEASRIGAALLEWRYVPVLLSGNIIHLPGRTLFVTEACSGLRSLSALVALGLLLGGVWLRSPISRAILLFAAIPVAVVLNGVRIFLTGFLVYYVDPALGEGLMHYTEGWALFIVSFGILGALTWLFARAEQCTGRAT